MDLGQGQLETQAVWDLTIGRTPYENYDKLIGPDGTVFFIFLNHLLYTIIVVVIYYRYMMYLSLFYVAEVECFHSCPYICLLYTSRCV